GTVGRREIATARRSQRAVTVGTRCARAVRLDRVVDNVLRQDVDDAIGIVFTNLVHLLQVVIVETDKAHVAEAEQLTALNATRTIELPVAQQAIDSAANTAQEPVAAANGQLVNPVDFERMAHR